MPICTTVIARLQTGMYSMLVIDTYNYLTLMYGSQWGSLAAAHSLYKSLLQVTQESISGTISHARSV